MIEDTLENRKRSCRREHDAILLMRIARGGEDARQALAELYTRHVAAVHVTLGRLDRCLSWQDREDLAQHVFVEVWRNPGRFRGESSVFHYLVRIAANLLSKRRRGDFRRARREAASLRIRPPDGLEPLRQYETADLVRLTLAALPADQQQAVELVYLHGRTVAEAARIVSCSTGALQMRLHRGKTFLLRHLGQIL